DYYCCSNTTRSTFLF
nr:immunoglobulin light chain junction region [Macaca mulatta]MOY05250.1 immunoglobulin light chain junction region [Macaca mulatta]MOY06607.1 immunoglobulin light chain junction region [Macaca mulatta]